MLLYVEYLKELAKLQELVSDYSKAVGYQVNIQKSTVVLYTNKEQVEFETKNAIPLPLAVPKMKFVGMTLTKSTTFYMRKNVKLLKMLSKN